MDRVTEAQVRSLAEISGEHCVSIYMPTHRAGSGAREDPIRLKNLIREAQHRIAQNDSSETTAQEFLKPGYDLVNDHDFWNHSEDSLALFIGPDHVRYFRTPLEVHEHVEVGERFHLRPLLKLLGERTFYVLAVSRNDARLLECTEHRIHQIRLPSETATSMQEALGGPKDHTNSGLWRQGGGARGQTHQGDIHGGGPDQNSTEQENINFYMRQLDEGVNKVIGEDSYLIVAGVDSTAPHYLHVAKHKQVHPEFIHGNFEHVNNEDLLQKGLDIMRPIWKEEDERLKERFGTARAQGIASADVVEIVRAASEGRVDTLFVSTETVANGVYDETANRVEASPDGQHDLVDLAVMKTLLASGKIVVTDPGGVPDEREAAAIYRY